MDLGAWLGAALWGLHPVQVESVAWFTELKNTQSGVFVFLSMLCFLRFRPLNGPDAARVGDWRYYPLVLVLFLCALLSKTVTCSLPAVLMLLIWWKTGRLGKRDALELTPLFALGAALGFMTTWVEAHVAGAVGAEWSLTLIQRCLNAGRALWFYAGKLLWPRHLTFVYPRWEIDAGAPWQYAFPLAALAVLIALWLLRSRIGRGPLVAVLCFAGTLLPVLCGGGILLLKTLHPFKSVLEEIARHRGTILPAVPSFYRALLAVPEFGRLPLRLCISGGAPLPVEVFNEFTRKFPFPLREGYGPTESSPVATVNPIHGTNKPGSIGKPIPNVELSIRDEAGQELPVGATGEICICGGNVMRGYWKQPEETAKVLRDGWLYTGDVGYRDAEGYYYITDRKKDMLLVNGINVYPREIEEVICQFPGVKEAAVIGVPDARKGEQPVAFVAVAEGEVVEEKALLQFVRGKLAGYKVPKRVVYVAVLPRNVLGKILKTALRQQPLA